MQWIQLIIPCSRQLSEVVETAAMAVGALSVTLQDAADQPILEPAVGETPLWDDCVMTALFSSEADTKIIDEQLAAYLPGSVKQRWEQLEDKDWSQECKYDRTGTVGFIMIFRYKCSDKCYHLSALATLH